MTPEKVLTQVMTCLAEQHIQPINVGSTGGDGSPLIVRVKVRNQADLDRLQQLGVDWQLTVAPDVLGEVST